MGRSGGAWVLLLFAGHASSVRGEDAVADFIIRVPIGSGGLMRKFYGARANTAPAPPDPVLLVEAPRPSDACARLPQNAIPQQPFALIAKRGGCTFADKLSVANAAGASLLVVINTIDSVYVSDESYALTHPCVVDCAAGSMRINTSFTDPTSERLRGFRPACEGLCASGDCAASGILVTDRLGPAANIEICCLPDTLMVMDVSDANHSAGMASAPAVFVGRSDGIDLLRFARGGAAAVMEDRPHLAVEPSMFIIWAIGVCAASLASWLGAGKERADACAAAEGDGVKDGGALTPREAPEEEEEEEPLELTAVHAFMFVFVASVSLVCMFLLLQVRWARRVRCSRAPAGVLTREPSPPRRPPRAAPQMGMYWIIRVIQLMFCIGCVTALFQFAFYPLTHHFLLLCAAQRRCGRAAARGSHPGAPPRAGAARSNNAPRRRPRWARRSPTWWRSYSLWPSWRGTMCAVTRITHGPFRT